MWEFVINEIHEVTVVLERIVKKIFVDLDCSKCLLKAPTYKITKYIIAALLLRLAFVMNLHFGPKEEIKCSNDCTYILQ
jgi:hypothetical protein